MIEEEQVEAAKQLMVAASFTAWQTMDTKMTFNVYLKALGLAEKEPELTDSQIAFMVERGLGIADRINEAYCSGRFQNG